MKKLIQSAFALLVASVAMTACVSESVDFGRTENPNGGDTGFVAFGEEGVSVITDSEIVRAAAPDVNSFLCSLVNAATNEVVKSFTYGERPASPIELKVGSYMLKVTSSNTIPAAEWESPVYGAEVPFEIQRGVTKTLEPVKCKLSNIKVTVDYGPYMLDVLEAGSKTDISLGATKMEFPYTETRAAYFKAVEATNSLLVEMHFTLGGKSSKMSHTITGVKAGQWRKITINMPHVSEGNVTFTITIETLTLDEEIVVDVAEVALLAEEVIPDAPVVDPLAPSVAWAGHDLTQTTQLVAANFDESGACTLPSNLVFTAKEDATIQSLAVEIGSTNSSFIDELAGMNINRTSFDLCEVTAASDRKLNMALKSLGFLTGTDVKGQSSVTFDLREAMVTMYVYNGMHEFKFAVTDSKGHTGEAVLSILVDKNNESGVVTGGPVIEWLNNDISVPHVVTEDLQVAIQVSTNGVGISGFTVDIVSDVLTAEALGDMLPTHIDLVNPGEYEEKIAGLGFPVKEGVTNAENGVLNFDITGFMPALIGISGGEPCYANFVMNVTDNNGATTEATLQLLLNQ